jgi:hypothetical protein
VAENNDIPDELPEGEQTFPREYVEKLRAEAAKHRTARKEAEDRAAAAEASVAGLQEQVFRFKVEQTGKLADATDLVFDAALLESDEALTGAVDTLLASKPHLASRRVSGDVGQGAGEPNPAEVSLAGLLSHNA